MSRNFLNRPLRRVGVGACLVGLLILSGDPAGATNCYSPMGFGWVPVGTDEPCSVGISQGNNGFASSDAQLSSGSGCDEYRIRVYYSWNGGPVTKGSLSAWTWRGGFAQSSASSLYYVKTNMDLRYYYYGPVYSTVYHSFSPFYPSCY
jgi:hypothetical protein